MVIGMLVRPTRSAFTAIGLSLFLAQLLITASRSDAKLSEVFLLRIHSARISAEKVQALELVQRQSAVKSQFLGTVSHELRTPIHGMLGVARLVHVETTDPLVKKRMELVEASGTHLLGLVTDLLDISRIESGHMRIQRIAFDLSSEVERVATSTLFARGREGPRVHDGQPPGPGRLGHRRSGANAAVLHNLLGNAMKFTHKGWVHLMGGPARCPARSFRGARHRVGISEMTRRWSSTHSGRAVRRRSPGPRHGLG